MSFKTTTLGAIGALLTLTSLAQAQYALSVANTEQS